MFNKLLGTTAHLVLTAALCASPASASAKAPKMLYSFAGGANGSAPYADLTFFHGLFYGTTYSDGQFGAGTLYSFDPKTQQQAVLLAFDGSNGNAPSAPLLAVGNLLYGSTLNAGTTVPDGNIFSIDPKSGKQRNLYVFAGAPDDGADPVGDLATDGTFLYGVTFYGGTDNGGTIFKVNIASGAETTLHSFTGADGAHPHGGLVLQGGILYGTAEFGASNACNDKSAQGCGALFEFAPATNAFTTLYEFQGGDDAANPAGGLIAENGALYGTTTQGGSANCKGLGCGTVFQFDPAAGTETVLYRFNADTGKLGTTKLGTTKSGDGTYPFGGVSYLSGALYGMTEAGGRGCKGGSGTIYKIDLATNAETLIYAFNARPGCAYPVARPTYHGNAFYATSPGGGTTLGGEIFKFKP